MVSRLKKTLNILRDLCGKSVGLIILPGLLCDTKVLWQKEMPTYRRNTNHRRMHQISPIKKKLLPTKSIQKCRQEICRMRLKATILVIHSQTSLASDRTILKVSNYVYKGCVKFFRRMLISGECVPVGNTQAALRWINTQVFCPLFSGLAKWHEILPS